MKKENWRTVFKGRASILIFVLGVLLSSLLLSSGSEEASLFALFTSGLIGMIAASWMSKIFNDNFLSRVILISAPSALYCLLANVFLAGNFLSAGGIFDFKEKSVMAGLAFAFGIVLKKRYCH